jgi:hypothetical protein
VDAPESSERLRRTAFDAKVETLRGRRPLTVDYWDIHNLGQEPARWDYGD